jgi:hypothetical protein
LCQTGDPGSIASVHPIRAPAADHRLQRVGVRRGVAKVGHKWGNFGNAGKDRIPIRGAPDENHFTVSRTGEMGVHSSPFSKSKRKYRLACDFVVAVKTREPQNCPLQCGFASYGSLNSAAVSGSIRGNHAYIIG